MDDFPQFYEGPSEPKVRLSKGSLTVTLDHPLNSTLDMSDRDEDDFISTGSSRGFSIVGKSGELRFCKNVRIYERPDVEGELEALIEQDIPWEWRDRVCKISIKF